MSGIPPVLLVSNRYYIRNVTMAGKTELLALDLKNAVALDFDWQESRVYWSDVTSSGSTLSRMVIGPNHNNSREVRG